MGSQNKGTRRRRRQQGVTLIELAIGITITALLLAAGMPSFSEWIVNTKVRTAAELLQNGLQNARTEAIRRNATVRLNLTDAGGAMAWNIVCVNVTSDPCTDPLSAQAASEVNGTTRLGVTTASDSNIATVLSAGTGLPASITFSALGRLAAGANVARIDLTYSGATAARRLVVMISPGGQVRMCDPARASGDPQAC